METEPLLYRVEALGIIGALADIIVLLGSIERLLGGFDEEEEEENGG